MFSVKKKINILNQILASFSEILKFGLDNVSFHLLQFPQNGILLKKPLSYLVLWQFAVHIMPTVPNFYCP